MYTFNPIPAVDTINSHGGFYFILVIAALVFLLVWMNNDEEWNMYKVFILLCIPCGIAATISWNTGTYKEYSNTKVIGTFVKFETEGYKERSGKSYVDRHYTYAVYSVDSNNILFKADKGIEYPKNAVLYKN